MSGGQALMPATCGSAVKNTKFISSLTGNTMETFPSSVQMNFRLQVMELL
jgi:hypothetical protein